MIKKENYRLCGALQNIPIFIPRIIVKNLNGVTHCVVTLVNGLELNFRHNIIQTNCKSQIYFQNNSIQLISQKVVCITICLSLH